MSKRKKKKAPMVEEEPEVEVVIRLSILTETPDAPQEWSLNISGGKFTG